MRNIVLSLIVVACACMCMLTSCSIIQSNNKESFVEGYYFMRSKAKQSIFINMQEDTVQVYYMDKKRQNISSKPDLIFPNYSREKLQGTRVSISSFDIDFLTILLKLRPATQGMEPQINSNLNGVLYFGRRIDSYLIKYQTNPLKDYNRQIKHYGFSLGGFIGIGNTFVAPQTTQNQVQYEYDGIILNKGVSAIIAVDNFTLGVSLGFDNLLDRNGRWWIYQNKPNLGLVVGMNLN